MEGTLQLSSARGINNRMKVSELLFEEPGKVHTRVKDKKPEPRGAPEGWHKARAFDKKGAKNRSILKKMRDEQNQFFTTGDSEFNPPDDEMALPYNSGLFVLVMSGGEDSEKDMMQNRYYGVNVYFPWDGGEIEGMAYDDRAQKEWDNAKSRAKIITVAKEFAREVLPKYLGGGINNMVDLDDDDDSPEAKSLRDKLQTRTTNKRLKIMLGD